MEARKAKRRISRLAVHFISFVGRAANRRSLLLKSVQEAGEEVVDRAFDIIQKDEARRMAYGIVYAPDEIDTEGDTMTREEIEKAAYGFMEKRRTTSIDADHDGEAGRGYVAESWIIRAGDPLFVHEPAGAWAIGVRVTDEPTWQRILKGELTGLSLAGVGRVEEINKVCVRSREEPVAGSNQSHEAPDGLTGQVKDLLQRVERLEKRSAGRQSIVGGQDLSDTEDKGFRGFRIL